MTFKLKKSTTVPAKTSYELLVTHISEMGALLIQQNVFLVNLVELKHPCMRMIIRLLLRRFVDTPLQ